MTQTTIWRVSAIVLLTASLFVGVQRSSLAADEHHATPGPSSCDSMATPGNHQSDGANHAMTMSTPVAAVEIDLLYIDMMIPHHASIIALSQVALPHLQDERLRTMAQAIIDTQAAEIEELKGYRLRFFGDAEPQPLDESGMMQLMGDSSKPMDAMMREMDGNAQIAAFCAAADADLAFIDLAIPHHESAIAVSDVVLANAGRPEIDDVATRVIEAQQREIAELTRIRIELTGVATPEAAG